MFGSSRRIALAFILLFGFFARAATFQSPLLDHHGWRQADTASIARNFARERFNILYPQVDWRGDRPNGNVETGVELLAFVVGAISRSAGFHPEIGRLLNACLFLITAWLVSTFARRRYGDEVGIIAAFLYAFCFPLGLFIERAFMNEALLLCLSAACLVSAQYYLAHPAAGARRGALVVLLLASALLGSIKLPYLIIWAPVAGMFIEAYGSRVWRRWELWAMVGVDLGVAAAWYTHAHDLGVQSGLSFGLFNKTMDLPLVLSPDFALTMGKRLSKDILGPVGVIGGLAGLWIAIRNRRWAEPLGVLGFLAYLVLVARGNFAHDYYQLPILAIAPVVIAIGLSGLATRIASLARQQDARAGVLAAALGLAAFSSFARSVNFHSWYDYSREEAQLCALDASTLGPASDLAVVVGDRDPRLLSCLDRKGWLLPSEDVGVPQIQALVQRGAKLAVVSSDLHNAEVQQFLAGRGAPLFAAGAVRVFKLQ